MSKDSSKKQNSCGGKKNLMFAYGFIQLGSNMVSAIALVAIALTFCSIKNESKVFNECINEQKTLQKSTSEAVRFCNGGN